MILAPQAGWPDLNIYVHDNKWCIRYPRFSSELPRTHEQYHDCFQPYSSQWVFNNILPYQLNITNTVEKVFFHKLKIGTDIPENMNHGRNFYSLVHMTALGTV